MNHRLLSVPLAGFALIALAACSPGGSGEPLGTVQEVHIVDENKGTDATVEFSVTKVEVQPIELLYSWDLDEEDLEKTPTFVTYTLTLLEGDFGDYNLTPMFSSDGDVVLSARDTGGKKTTALTLIGGIDSCPGVGGDGLAGVQVGETVEACKIFMGDSEDGLSSVSLGDATWAVEPAEG